MSKTKTEYDWCWEQLDDSGKDVHDLYCSDRLQDKPFVGPAELCVIRSVYSTIDGDMLDRQRAYVYGWRLDDEFDGGNKVPKRHIKEFERWNRKRLK